MPELPDLQVFSNNLGSLITHKEIVSVDVNNPRKVNISGNEAQAVLAGSQIVDIIRDGKELFFHTDNKKVFSVHLMLNGKFDVCDTSLLSGIKYKILSINFADRQSFVISDFQGLCKVEFDPIVSNVPDALGSNFTFEYLLATASKNSRKNIKAFLINQDVVKGIGNAYADEILWHANISPESTVGKIPEGKLHDLYNAISHVLSDAIYNIKKINPDIISGEERSFLKVHNSKKQYTEEGDPIIIKKIASKTTYYVERQELFK